MAIATTLGVILTGARLLRCPYCGYEQWTTSIGAVHCGPHRFLMSTEYYPAVRMVEVISTGTKGDE